MKLCGVTFLRLRTRDISLFYIELELHQSVKNTSIHTLKQVLEPKHYGKVGFWKTHRSEKWLVSNPDPILTRVFNNFKIPQGVSTKNTPHETKKTYEKLIGKYLWARKKQFSRHVSNPEPIFTKFFEKFLFPQGESPRNTPCGTKKIKKTRLTPS